MIIYALETLRLGLRQRRILQDRLDVVAEKVLVCAAEGDSA